MASDDLAGRRKRGLMKMTGAQMTQSEMKRYQAKMAGGDSPEPGTSAFGIRAAARKERLRRGGRADLRIKTAAKTVSESTRKKNEYLSGD